MRKPAADMDGATDRRPSLAELFVSFLKMGAVLIGGGYALLPLLEDEIVRRRKWAGSADMADLYALAQALPGVIAVNTAMLVGQRLRGFGGVLAAAAGLTLVPFLLIAFYAAAYTRFRDADVCSRILSGIQPAVAGMVLGLSLDMIRRQTGRVEGALRRVPPYCLFALAAFASLWCGVEFVHMLAASVAAGLAWHLIAARRARDA